MTRRYTGGFLSAKEQATDSNTSNGIFSLSDAEQLTAAGTFPTGRWTPQRSLRFRNASNTYLIRPAVTGNRKTFTTSVWVKIGQPSTTLIIFEASDATGTTTRSPFRMAGDQIQFSDSASGGAATTTGSFRDPAAWYHIVASVDTTQTNSTDRIKIYVNGIRQISFSTYTAPTLNADTLFNSAAYYQTIASGRYWTGQAFDGYMSEFNHVDGLALDPTYFGTTDPETGTWVPKLYTGAYGNNGFYLPFSDISGLYPLTADRSSGSYVQTIGQGTANGYYISSATSTYQAVSTAFDGVIGSSYNNCFGIAWTGAISVAAGKDWGSGVTKTITAFRVTGSAIDGNGFNSGSATTTVKLQGSPDNSTWTDLYTSSAQPASTLQLTVTSGITTSTAYRYHRVSITENSAYGGSHVTVIGEVEFFEAGTGGLNCFFSSGTSLTAGVTYDSMVDVPSLPAVSGQTDIGGVQRGNYCTLNPLQTGSYSTLQNGNLRTLGNTATNSAASLGTIRVTSGKWYWEVTQGTTGSEVIGIAIKDVTGQSLINAEQSGVISSVGYGARYNGNMYGISSETYGGGTGNVTSWTTGDIIGIAVDMDNGAMYMSKNGTWMLSGNPLSGSAKTGAVAYWGPAPDRIMTPYCGSYNGGYTDSNFGQRPFTYTPPTGFKSLNTTNLPNPVIKVPSTQMDAKIYSGGSGYLNVGNAPKQGTNYQIANSLRFKGSTAARSPTLWRNYSTSGTGGSQKWTYSVWVKKGFMSSEKGTLLWGGQGGGSGSVTNTDLNNTGFMFEANGTLAFEGQNTQWFTTTTLFNDKTNWHHLVLACDTTLPAQTDRIKLYVDGVRITKFSAFNALTLNQTTAFSQATCFNQIGARWPQQDLPFDGFMAEANFVDGQQLAPTSFGQFDAFNNWVPTKYSGTYGTNGWYLPFTQPSLSNAGTSTYAASFDSTNTQYLTTPANAALTLSTTPFTVEFWMNLKATTGNIPVVCQDYTTGLDIRTDESGSNRLGFYMGNSTFVYGFYPTVWRDTWQHVAVVRNASNLVTMYVNGSPICSTTNSNNLTANTFRIGQLVTGSVSSAGTMFNGSISNVRVVKGTAVYTGQFTPPTGPLTAISGTVLLALTTATVTADASTNNFTLTNSGSVTADVSYPMAKNVGVDASGNGNDLIQSYTIDTPTSSVLTYGVPGTYTWVAPTGVTSVKALVIAGGGGGADNGGGGGAGGMIYNAAYSVTPGTSYTVTVGSGGRGGSGSSNLPQNGKNSVFATLTAVGGGSGSQQGVVAAGNGGSGGGGSYNYTTGGTPTSGQGNSGGTGSYGNGGNTYYGAGGGGAGGAGYNGGDSRGGPGLANSITGSLKYYAGGGGGNYFITNSPTWAVGGIGGGGSSNTGVYTMGAANTGGGGGTRGGNNGYWSTGGSGVVILSYTNANTYTGAGSNLLDMHDIATDSPTEYDASSDGNDIGGLVRGSYTKFNNAIKLYSAQPTITNGGLTMYSNTGDYSYAITDMPITGGKWYWEYTVQGNGSSGCYHGIMDAADFPYMTTNNQVPSNTSAAPRGFSLSPGGQGGGNYGVAYSGSAYNPSPGLYWESGDVIQFAFDADKKLVSVGKNGTWVQSQVPSTGANAFPIVGSGTYYPFAGSYDHPSLGTYGVTANFGQKQFVYTPPTGFKSINSKNLKDVGSYNLPDTYGNSLNTPDLVWTKSRTGPSAVSPRLYDTVRGAGLGLFPNQQGASTAETNQGLSAFTPNGFTLTSPVGAAPYALEDKTTYVAWMWNRGVTPGFDIVNYAGGQSSSAAGAINHNLGQVPAMIIVKNTTTSSDWAVWHKTYGAPTTYQTLNTTIVPTSNSAWFSSSPTSSTFTVGNALATGNGGSYVAYLWAEVPGFSKFGSYTGNGSADGPFVYLGFKPKWIMIKRTDSVSGADWQIQDSVRTTFNPTGGTALAANDNRSEGTFGFSCDILSNGFKIRATDTGCNASAGTYIYAAFAETPYKYANAR